MIQPLGQLLCFGPLGSANPINLLFTLSHSKKKERKRKEKKAQGNPLSEPCTCMACQGGTSQLATLKTTDCGFIVLPRPCVPCTIAKNRGKRKTKIRNHHTSLHSFGYKPEKDQVAFDHWVLVDCAHKDWTSAFVMVNNDANQPMMA